METIDNKSVYSLLEITENIKRTISKTYSGSYWIKAELNKLNYYKLSGHSYPELVEKRYGNIVVETKGVIWKEDFNSINQKFIKVLNVPLKDNIKILFCAKITYTPKYGLQLNIIDIDPCYSLGELERERLENIKKLKAEGIFDSNKKIKLEMLPRRIAIISVETSKGYSDFKKIIEGNSNGYKLYCMLFPSLLQGDKAVGNIIYQLKRIKKVVKHFDAVAIIRGGGGDIGLTIYNNYFLAKEIALFPIPVLTGIGHSTNETVSEMVAFKNAITPTELADYLLKFFDEFNKPLEKAKELLIEYSERILENWNMNLGSIKYSFKLATNNILSKSTFEIQNSIKYLNINSRHFIRNEKIVYNNNLKELKRYSNSYINKESEKIDIVVRSLKKDSLSLIRNSNKYIDQFAKMLKKDFGNIIKFRLNSLLILKANLIKVKDHFLKEKHSDCSNIREKVKILSPENILKRGYSITLKNGKVIKNAEEINNNDSIDTILFNGKIQSIVNNIKIQNE